MCCERRMLIWSSGHSTLVIKVRMREKWEFKGKEKENEELANDRLH